MMKKNLKNINFFLITVTLIGSLSSCSWGRKHAEDELDSLQEDAASLTDAGTDAVNGAVSTAASDGKTGAVATTSAYAPPKTEAFEVEGAQGVWMNAYYYVRSKDETLASISQTLYGTPDREKDLGKWNHRTKVNVGSLLYYSSATRPEDHAKILSSTEDKGQALEEVEVKAGETISKIAQNRYGDFKTWREIAALNPQVDPNHMVPGMKLKVAPGGTPEVASAVTAPSAPSAPDATAVVAAPAVPEQAPVAEPAAAQVPQAVAPSQAVVENPSVAPVAQEQTPTVDTPMNRNPASKTRPAVAATPDREPAEAGGWQAKVAPALEMFQENPALAGAVGLLALGLIGLGVRRLRSS